MKNDNGGPDITISVKSDLDLKIDAYIPIIKTETGPVARKFVFCCTKCRRLEWIETDKQEVRPFALFLDLVIEEARTLGWSVYDVKYEPDLRVKAICPSCVEK